MDALSIVVRGVLAVLGRLLGQLVGVRWDLDHKRREVRVQFLVEAWRRIERAANRAGQAGAEEARGLEQALADLQLFGTPAQADQAARVARSIGTTGGASAIDELLEDLRVELRDE